MFPQQLFTQWLIVSVDSNISDFYSVDHESLKKEQSQKKEKQSPNDSFDLSKYWFESVRLFNRNNCSSCVVVSQCKDAHLVSFLLMFIFFSLKYNEKWEQLSLHYRCGFFIIILERNSRPVFSPQIFRT